MTYLYLYKTRKNRIHGKLVSERKIKPRRIITRRNEELLCCIDSQQNNNSETIQ